MKNSPAPEWKRFLSTAILVLSCLLLFWYIRVYGDKFEVLKVLNLGHILVLMGLSLISYANSSLALKAFAAHFGYRVPYADSFFLTALSAYWNYLPGRMGTFVRATHLKLHFRLPFSLYAVYMTAPQILSFMLYSATALIVCLICLSRGIDVSMSLVIFLSVLFVLSFFVSRMNPRRILNRLPDVKSLKVAITRWGELWNHPPVIIKLSIVTLMSIVLVTARWSFLFYILFGLHQIPHCDNFRSSPRWETVPSSPRQNHPLNHYPPQALSNCRSPACSWNRGTQRYFLYRCSSPC